MGDRGGTKGDKTADPRSNRYRGIAPQSGPLAEAARQRELLKNGVRVAGVLAPGPIGIGMAAGNLMSAASERVLAAHPEKIKTIPGVPGGVYGNVGGVTYSNRADYPGSPSEKSAKRTGRQDRLGAAAVTLYG